MINCFAKRLTNFVRKSSTYSPSFIIPNTIDPIPTYQVLDPQGNVNDPSQIPKMSNEKMVEIFKNMVFLNTMDDILLESQRQGRTSFYMTHYGEEALVAMAEAFTLEDLVSTQYRELGFLIQRGYSLNEVMNLTTSNMEDYAIGRQSNPMYMSTKLNIFMNSAPLATQIPQAVGQGYAKKISGDKSCVVVFFGDGCASEGDAFTGLNFAGALKSQVVFVCRNNQYAISTHISEQYCGDAIAGRSVAMGIPTIRVDGNDVFAMYNSAKAAREMCVGNGSPVLIEAMSYRISHHSTSDDSAAYRRDNELEGWKTLKSPFTRFRNYLVNNGLWDLSTEKEFRRDCFKNIVDKLKEKEQVPKPGPDTIFNQMYSELPSFYNQQRNQLQDHINKYRDYYNN